MTYLGITFTMLVATLVYAVGLAHLHFFIWGSRDRLRGLSSMVWLQLCILVATWSDLIPAIAIKLELLTPGPAVGFGVDVALISAAARGLTTWFLLETTFEVVGTAFTRRWRVAAAVLSFLEFYLTLAFAVPLEVPSEEARAPASASPASLFGIYLAVLFLVASLIRRSQTLIHPVLNGAFVEAIAPITVFCGTVLLQVIQLFVADTTVVPMVQYLLWSLFYSWMGYWNYKVAFRMLRARLDEKSSVGTVSLPHLADSFRLSARESEVLSLLLQGLVTKEVAARLRISVNTARNHGASVYKKLGVTSRTELFNSVLKPEFLGARQDTSLVQGEHQ